MLWLYTGPDWCLCGGQARRHLTYMSKAGTSKAQQARQGSRERRCMHEPVAWDAAAAACGCLATRLATCGCSKLPSHMFTTNFAHEVLGANFKALLPLLLLFAADLCRRGSYAQQGLRTHGHQAPQCAHTQASLQQQQAHQSSASAAAAAATQATICQADGDDSRGCC
jgi:hypothetical protein